MLTYSPLIRIISDMQKLRDMGAHSQMMDLHVRAIEMYGNWWLLINRIHFRKRWAMRTPRPRTEHPAARLREIEYDELHNFARMGVEYVDDNWGRPWAVKKVKRKAA